MDVVQPNGTFAKPMRATFIFPNPRAALMAGIAAGSEPDSTLLGANHLAEHRIEAHVHDPLLSRRDLRPPFDRIAWNLRELTLPFEIGRSDVVFTPLANILPLAARARAVPVVVINYGLNLIWRRASPRRRALLGRSLRTAARVVCLGESQRAELVAEVGLREEHVETLLVPVDATFFSPEASAPDGSIFSVGKDLARDYGTLVDAIRGIDAEVRLVVHPRNIEGLELPLNTTARRLSSIDLRDAYARAACVVVPQRSDDYPYGSEGGGLTALLEAMAMGKPVVATERGILRDYVDHGVEALLVPPEDPAALREAIERVLGDAELASRLGSAARARVERAHTTHGFADRLAPVLRTVAR
ncbi:MAG: putative glycosyltransferase [Actinomycetia bacterium]|jgi:glycosyltransferase involved in cell wall biosynthesis|nr:putative glycosyltransferase [Actinomycetes bacterium]